jgi:hypothetical protein
MSTVIVTIGGTLTPGDLLMLSYSTPRGGLSTLKYRVRLSTDSIVTDPATGAKSVHTTGDTIANVVNGFVEEFERGQEWPLSEFEVTKRSDTSFVVKQKNVENFFANLTFMGYVQGMNGMAPTETVELEVL